MPPPDGIVAKFAARCYRDSGMASKHTVDEGECLSSISFDSGFFVDTLWNHPDNAQLKELRKDPTVLMAGDVVSIPDKREGKKSISTGARHSFKRKGVPAKFKTRLLIGSEPRKNLAYTLLVDGKVLSGQTDGDGVIEQSIPPSATSATLVLRDGDVEERYEIALGHMDPISEPSGVQARLQALGFTGGDPDEGARQAVRAFQRHHGLDPSGELDDATRDKLKEQSGG
jgi:hypothetical protein